MRLFLPLMLGILCLLSTAADAKTVGTLKRESKTAVERFLESDPDMRKHFESAYGFAIFPRVGKGGMVVGAAHGKGLVYRGGKMTGRATLTQVNVGFQLGGQSFSQVIFFQNEETYQRFIDQKLEFGAQVSAVAAAEGASANAAYRYGVMVFTIARGGLMYEASVGGQQFTFEEAQDPDGTSLLP